MATSVERFLERVDTAAQDVNEFTGALAEKLRQGGDVVLRASNTARGAAYGAAAGARTGSAFPTEIPRAVLYGGAAVLAYLLLRR